MMLDKPDRAIGSIALLVALGVTIVLAAAPEPLAFGQASSCGNAILEPPEECDPPGGLVCPPAVLSVDPQACNADCTCPHECPPFSFLVRTKGKVGNGGTIDGGIGANDAGGLFRIGKGVLATDGHAIAGDKVKIGADTSVFDVLANTLQTSQGVTLRGSQGIPTLPLTNPFCPMPTFTCGGPDVEVPTGGSVTLAPGSYGRLIVKDNGAVTLEPGTFAFCSVKTGRAAAVATTGGTQSTINVVGGVRLLNQTFLGPASGTPAPNVNLAGKFLRVSQGSRLEAFVSAPDALISVGRSSNVTGSFCAATSRSDKQTSLTCRAAPFLCGSQCNIDGICDAGENHGSCWTDCEPVVSIDGVCDRCAGEDFANAPSDCPMLCGDGYCDPEAESSCGDCPAPSPPFVPLPEPPRCGDGSCALTGDDDEENTSGCPEDCPSPRCNHNGICEPEEPYGEIYPECDDCALYFPPAPGDGVCQVDEGPCPTSPCGAFTDSACNPFFGPGARPMTRAEYCDVKRIPACGGAAPGDDSCQTLRDRWVLRATRYRINDAASQLLKRGTHTGPSVWRLPQFIDARFDDRLCPANPRRTPGTIYLFNHGRTTNSTRGAVFHVPANPQANPPRPEQTGPARIRFDDVADKERLFTVWSLTHPADPDWAANNNRLTNIDNCMAVLGPFGLSDNGNKVNPDDGFCDHRCGNDGYSLPNAAIRTGPDLFRNPPPFQECDDPNFTPKDFGNDNADACTTTLNGKGPTPRWGHNSNNDADAEHSWFQACDWGNGNNVRNGQGWLDAEAPAICTARCDGDPVPRGNPAPQPPCTRIGGGDDGNRLEFNIATEDAATTMTVVILDDAVLADATPGDVTSPNDGSGQPRADCYQRDPTRPNRCSQCTFAAGTKPVSGM